MAEENVKSVATGNEEPVISQAKATQKEKLVKATQMAMRIKSMASRLRHDAIDSAVHTHCSVNFGINNCRSADNHAFIR